MVDIEELQKGLLAPLEQAIAELEGELERREEVYGHAREQVAETKQAILRLQRTRRAITGEPAPDGVGRKVGIPNKPKQPAEELIRLAGEGNVRQLEAFAKRQGKFIQADLGSTLGGRFENSAVRSTTTRALYAAGKIEPLGLPKNRTNTTEWRWIGG